MNRGQGIGFCIGTTVLNKQNLFKFAAIFYTVAAAAVSWIVSQNAPLEVDLDAAGSSFFCEPGWFHADGSCYRLFGLNATTDPVMDTKTWPQAESYCQGMDGHLASISSPAQLEMIRSLAGLSSDESNELITSPKVWIGLTDRDGQDTWVWSDGDPTEFTRWAPGQPDDLDYECADGSPSRGNCAAVEFEVERATAFRPLGVRREDYGDEACCAALPSFVCSKPSTPSASSSSQATECLQRPSNLPPCLPSGGAWRCYVRLRRRALAYGHRSQQQRPTTDRGAHPTAALFVVHSNGIRAQASAAHPPGVVRGNLATTVTLNANASNAAECQSLVRALHPTANGATFGNRGERWCKAVFGA